MLQLLLGEGDQLLVVSDLPFPQPHPSNPDPPWGRQQETGPTMPQVWRVVPCE